MARGVAGNDDALDVLVVGAGPAGLTAATYLARFHRRVVVIDSGNSRARWIPETHNCPGFPFGISGPALLQKLHKQAEGYGARLVSGRVVELEQEDAGFVATDTEGATWRTQYVLLATGIVDRMPEMDRVEDAVASGALRLCAVCDGYEASDERIAVHGPADEAIRHAVFLRTFSRTVSVLPTVDSEPSTRGAQLAELAAVTILPAPAALRHVPGKGCLVECPASGDADAQTHVFETLYPVLGGDAQSSLATALGAEVDDNDELVVDDHLRTSIDGLYAIGDIVSALNQISVAVGHAAIAATAIHGRLPHNFREDREQQPEGAEEVPTP